ncbi:MAG: VOC family protein [Ekhidna sp.]
MPNLSEAKEWYTKVFSTDPYFENDFYIGFNVMGYELGLYLDKTSSDKKSDNIESLWGVSNVEKEHKRMIELGATEHSAPQNVGGDIIVSNLKDPWGNVIGLICNPHFKLP